MNEADSDGFIVVKAKSRRSIRPRKCTADDRHAAGGLYPIRSKPSKDPVSTTERYITEITSKQKTLTKSKFYSALNMQVLKEFAPEEIVCYGIGSFSSSISQWQLALILALNHSLCAPIYAFDPVVTAEDIDIMRHFKVFPITENEQAKRKVNKRTLFYMPHCEQFLYENAVAANWSAENLRQVMFVGNHFSSYQNSQTCQTFAKNSPHIKQLLEHLTCIDFPHEALLGLKHCPYAFSDMCVQYVRLLDISHIDFLPYL